MATERDAADMTGPYGGELASPAPGATVGRSTLSAIPLTTSSVVFDMSDTNHFAGDHYVNRFIRMIADQGFYYFWTNNASATVTETATNGTTRNQQCDFLPANTRGEEVPSGRYLVVKGLAAGTVRLSIVQTVKPGQ